MSFKLANPFVGPRPFQRGEKIFGRAREARELLYLLTAERIVWMHSPSGAGKSSLINAGLIPRLERDGFTVYPTIRVNLEPSDSEGAEGNRYLRSTLLSLEEGIPEEQRFQHDALEKMGLNDYLTARSCTKTGLQNIVLIFDQFEEILTVEPLLTQQKYAFFQEIGKALRNENRWALFSLREEFLAQMDPYIDWIPTQWTNTFQVRLLAEETVVQIAQKTAALGGRNFKESAAHTLFEDLAKVRVQRPDGGFSEQIGLYAEPVQLQVVCRRLWKEMPDKNSVITRKDLEKFGDVSQALGGYYSDAVAQIAQNDVTIERNIRKWVAHHLITLSGIRGQVLRGAKESEGLNNGIIAKLLDTHLLRGEKRAGATWYELSHDRLVQPIQESNESWFEYHLQPFQKVAAVWIEQRYPDTLLLRGKELRAALRWQKKNVVVGDEERFLELSRKLSWRKKMIALVIIAAVTAISLFAFVAYQQKQKAERQTEKAEEAQKNALRNLSKAFEEKALAALKTAKEKKDVGEYKKAVLFTSAALEHPELSTLSPEARGGLFAPEVFRAALAERWISPMGAAHQGAVNSVSFSPDGTQLASASDDKTVRIWDLARGKELTVLKGHTDIVSSVVFSPDGSRLASASHDKTIRIWDVESEDELTLLIGHDKRVNNVTFSPDGKQLASSSADKTIRIWDIASNQELSRFVGHTGEINSVSFSPDGKSLASGSQDETIRIWDIESGKEKHHFKDDTPSAILHVIFSPDGRKLASASSYRSVRIWDIESGEEQAIFKGFPSHIHNISFSPDGNQLGLASSQDNSVRLLDIESVKELTVFRGHTDFVGSVSFSPDGKILASASHDKTIRIWDVASSQELRRFVGHTGEINSVSFSPDGRRIASASYDKTVRLRDVESGKELTVFRGHDERVYSVSFSPDGIHLASASADTTIRLWDAESGKELTVFRGHDKRVYSVSFSPDGGRLASSSYDKTIRLWDIAGGEELAVFRGHDKPVFRVSFSPDGKLLASASEDKTVRIWDVASGRELMRLAGHTAWVRNVAFSPDGKQLASASQDKTIRLWDVQNGEELTVFRGCNGRIYGLAFSPDGKQLASASQDSTVRLWNVENGKEMAVFRSHTDSLTDVSYSPDGRRLVSSSWDGTIQLWDLRLAMRFLQDGQSTSLYRNFIQGATFFWQVKRDGLEFVPDYRIPTDKNLLSLINPPPKGQSKFNQILQWAEKQQKKM